MASFTNAYTSMSGIDITATFDNVPIGTLQGISYSVTREKSPVYTFGSANPRSFSRGKRGLAGSMIFTLFDRTALYNLVHDKDHYYYAHAHEPINIFDPRINKDVFSLYADFTTVGLTETGEAVDASGNPVTTPRRVNPDTGEDVLTTPAGTPTGAEAGARAVGAAANAAYGVSTVRVPAEYADQIMPFDITLIAQNEYGLAAFMVIIGCEILNEGGGLSVDDITNEEQTTFVARGKTPWIPWTGTQAGAQTDAEGARISGTSTVFPFTEINQAGRLGDFYGSANIPGAQNA